MAVIGTIVKVNFENGDFRIYTTKNEYNLHNILRKFTKEYGLNKVKIKEEDSAGYFEITGTKNDPDCMAKKFIYYLEKTGWKNLLKNINNINFKD